MLNKNNYGAKKGEANQKQQLSDYGYIAIPYNGKLARQKTFANFTFC